MCEINQQKVAKYETFLNDTLKADLKKLTECRQIVFQDIANHMELRNTILALKRTGTHSQKMKAKIDLGCNFYSTARVDNPSMIYVLVGFGFYVEMSHSEALRYIDRRVSLLEEKSHQIGRSAVAVRAKVDLVLEGLRELQNMKEIPE